MPPLPLDLQVLGVIHLLGNAKFTISEAPPPLS